MKVAITTLAFVAVCFVNPLAVQAIDIYFDAAHDTDSSNLATLTFFTGAVASAGYLIEEFVTPITAGALAPYDVVMILDPEIALDAAEITAIQEWMAANPCRGLWVVGSQPTKFHRESVNALLAPYFVQFTEAAGEPIPDVAVPVGSHPTMSGVTELALDSHGELMTVSPAVCIAEDTPMDCVAAAVEFPNGVARLAVWGDASTFKNTWFGQYDEDLWMRNTINWLAECGPVSVDESTWGGVKALYR